MRFDLSDEEWLLRGLADLAAGTRCSTAFRTRQRRFSCWFACW